MFSSTNIRTPTACSRSILLALKPGGRGLTVVGDDAQSIYSFRAATVRNILDFPDAVHAAGRDHHARSQLSLDADRSSPPPTASSISRSERFTKNLWTDRTSGARPQLVTVRDEADQARYIVERVLENREAGTLLKQQAVLFRDLAATADRSKSNSPGATFRSSNSAG